jgi:fructose-bisphosphate aldolase, class II
VETAEIHLATNFQTMLFDHLPGALREEIYGWLGENAKDERKSTDTDEQFFYKTRKKALGPFKRQLWDLSTDVKERLARAYDEKFSFLFTQLAVAGTKQHADKYVKQVPLHHSAPEAAAPDDADLSD